MLGGLRWLALCLVVLKAGSACMAQQVTATAKGLYLAPNDLGDVPDGALAQADNVVISKEGVVEARRGQSVVSTKTLHRALPFEGRVVAHNSSGNLLSYSAADVSSWTDYSGTFNEPVGGKVHGSTNQGNLYLTEASGMKRVETVTGSVYDAGMPKALSPIMALSTPAGTALATGNQVAYKVVLARRDASGKLYQGPTSGRAVISNSSGSTKNVLLTVPIPYGIPAGTILQIYRTPASGSTTLEPSDSYQAVYEGAISAPTGTITTLTFGGVDTTLTTSAAHGLSTDMWVRFDGPNASMTGSYKVTATPAANTFKIAETPGTGAGLTIPFHVSAIDVTDIVPDALIGANLFTNDTEEGATQDNDLPPISGDVARFKDTTFFGDTAGKFFVARMTLISVDTTLANVWTALDFCAGNQVAVTAFAIQNNTIPVVETYNANTYSIGHVVVTTGTATQTIRDTVQSIVRVVNMARQPVTANGTDYVYAAYLSGSNDIPGEVIFWSTSEFTVAIEAPYRTVQEWLPSEKLATRDDFGNAIYWSKDRQPDAVPALNFQRVGSEEYEIKRIVPTRDALFIFKDDGIWRLTGSGGVWDIQPIDPTVSCPAPESLVAFENAVYGLFESGVGRVTESGVEILSGPIQAALDPLLNPAMASTLESVAFGINYDAAHKYILWLPSASTDTLATQAYVFDTWTAAWTRWLPPTGITGFAHGIVNPADGRLYMVDGTSVYRERKAGDDTDFQDLTSTAIPAVVKYAPRFGGNPGQLHQFREASFIFRRVQFSSASVGFSTNLSPVEETITLAGSDYGVNSAAGTQTTIRALVPREKSRASQLNVKFSHAQAGQGFQLQGVSVVFTPSSTRVSR